MNKSDKPGPAAGTTPRNPTRGDAKDQGPATGAQTGRTPDRQGGRAAGEGRTADADIPDDYGQETSNPDDLEPPDEHQRG